MRNWTHEIVRMTDIHKSFGSVHALKGVKLQVHAGEVHALVGENGAGKSTLIKTLMGVHQKDQGQIFIEGDEVTVRDPIHAGDLGLGCVYQDVNIARHLTVGENLFMGKLPKKNGLVDWETIYSETKKTLESLNIQVNPREVVKHLSVAQQEMVVIAKTVHQDCKLVVFDEPTALLANEEVEELFKIIETLKNKGIAVIYISHRLEEIFQICDTITVFKDGAWVNTVDTKETDEDKLIAMMVGRTIEDMYSIEHCKPGEVVLDVRGLTRTGVFENINLNLRKSEVLGMFGLVGSGRTEIMRAIFGADSFEEGTIELFGEEVKITSPIDAIERGIGLLPEDRKEQGLSLSTSVKENINLAAYDRIISNGLINLKKESSVAKKYVKDLLIKTPTIDQKVKNLSGGNQQKVVIGKWLNRDSRIFIFDEPTVGIDVGAKREIFRLFEKILEAGNSIVLISSYLPEAMGISDRLVVIHEGHKMGTLMRNEFEEERILRLASGIKDTVEE